MQINSTTAFALISSTVDRLWSITEDLNILYKENWTRLAAQEVQHFQVSVGDCKWIANKDLSIKMHEKQLNASDRNLYSAINARTQILLNTSCLLNMHTNYSLPISITAVDLKCDHCWPNSFIQMSGTQKLSHTHTHTRWRKSVYVLVYSYTRAWLACFTL